MTSSTSRIQQPSQVQESENWPKLVPDSKRKPPPPPRVIQRPQSMSLEERTLSSKKIEPLTGATLDDRIALHLPMMVALLNELFPHLYTTSDGGLLELLKSSSTEIEKVLKSSSYGIPQIEAYEKLLLRGKNFFSEAQACKKYILNYMDLVTACKTSAALVEFNAKHKNECKEKYEKLKKQCNYIEDIQEKIQTRSTVDSSSQVRDNLGKLLAAHEEDLNSSLENYENQTNKFKKLHDDIVKEFVLCSALYDQVEWRYERHSEIASCIEQATELMKNLRSYKDAFQPSKDLLKNSPGLKIEMQKNLVTVQERYIQDHYRIDILLKEIEKKKGELVNPYNYVQDKVSETFKGKVLYDQKEYLNKQRDIEEKYASIKAEKKHDLAELEKYVIELKHLETEIDNSIERIKYALKYGKRLSYACTTLSQFSQELIPISSDSEKEEKADQ